MGKEEFIRHKLDAMFRVWLWRAAAWGATLFMLLVALDFAVTPENAETFLWFRVFIAALLLSIFFLAKRSSNRDFHELLAYIAVVASAITIEFMIMRFGGHASPYYAGMLLLCISVLGFFPARFSFHVSSALIIYLIYLVPIIAVEKITDVRAFVTANAFMILVFITSLFMRYLSGKSLVDEIGMRYELERYSERLEQSVKDRTYKLLDATEEWEETFNIINDAITIHDQDFTIKRYNRAAEDMLGLSLSSSRKQKCYEICHGAGSPPRDCPACKVLQTGKSAMMELFEPHLNRHLEVKALPRLNGNNEITGVIHVIRDITERKKGEEEQEKLQSQLLQAQKIESIGRLAGGVAHDFNNILSAVLGYGELSLMRLPHDHPIRQNLVTIKEAGERGASLTRQLLAFSRKQVLEMKAININITVEHMAKMLMRLIGEDISLELNTKAPVRNILADPGQIEQVIMNLAVNARDAMPFGGRLLIETADTELDEEYVKRHEFLKPGPYVQLSVSDTGLGMARGVLDRIFEPFFTTKELGKGTGLGLAAVYGIVKQHNGFIFAESAPGKGSTFTIYLPVTQERLSDSRTPEAETMPKGSETILVAEDALPVRNLVMDILNPLGYQVVLASSGEEALRKSDAFEGPIALLLTDVVMPGMNGRELAEVLQAARPAIKVVFMSGYTDDEIARHGILDSGAILLQKPITPTGLAKKIREVLDGRTEAVN